MKGLPDVDHGDFEEVDFYADEVDDEFANYLHENMLSSSILMLNHQQNLKKILKMVHSRIALKMIQSKLTVTPALRGSQPSYGG